MATEKKVRKNTPVGAARWAHLVKPKAPFKNLDGTEKGDAKYCIDVVFDPTDPAWNAFAKGIKETVQALPVQYDKRTDPPTAIPHQFPIRPELDDNDVKTGKWIASFKTSAAFKPSVFDARGKLMEDVLVGNGSLVRVNYSENVYDGFGGGMNLYLNAVQVVTLVPYAVHTAESYGFDKVDTPADDEAPF